MPDSIGPYELRAEIGRGGMGVVYQARDTKLDRDVAIKALPEAMAGDAERPARFEREARLLASLNHANIASIYGLEQATEARRLFEEALAMDPSFVSTRPMLGQALLALGHFDEAIEQMELGVLSDDTPAIHLGWLCYAYGSAGRADDAREELRRLEEMSATKANRTRHWRWPASASAIWIGHSTFSTAPSTNESS
ncbi:MAG: protein kinase domain-containing protein [Planctomycetota bacterium]|jgi:tetratricopeptide (TPR) repeat protein